MWPCRVDLEVPNLHDSMDPTRLHASGPRAATGPPRRHSFVTTSQTPKSHSSWSENPFHCCCHHRCDLPPVLLSLRLTCFFSDVPFCLFLKDPPEGTDFPAFFCSVLIVSFPDHFGSGLWVTPVLSPHLPHPRGQPLTRVLCASRLMETERQRMSQARKGSSSEVRHLPSAA